MIGNHNGEQAVIELCLGKQMFRMKNKKFLSSGSKVKKHGCMKHTQVFQKF